MFKITYTALKTFFRRPQEQMAPLAASSTKIKIFLATYLIFLLPTILSSAGTMLAARFGGIDTEDHKLLDMLDSMPAAVILLSVVVMAPLFEELIFRLPLRWERAYIFKIFLLPVRLGGKETYQMVLQQVHGWWQRHYSYVFYFTVVAFGLIHLVNFRTQLPFWKLLLWGPFLVLPQLILGAMLGFIRLKLGFWWSVLLHAVHNLIFVGIALLAVTAETANLEIHQTDNYRLAYQWYEAEERPEKVNNQITDTELSYERICVDDLFRYLVTNDSSRYESTDTLGERFLKLEFKMKHQSLDQKRLLMQALAEHLDLKLEKSHQAMELYELYVEDSTKLASNQQEPLEGSQINQSLDSLTFEYTNLKKITRHLQQNHWDRILRYADDDYDLYEVRLANTDFDELKKELLNQYGLGIRGPQVDSIWMYRLQGVETTDAMD